VGIDEVLALARQIEPRVCQRETIRGRDALEVAKDAAAHDGSVEGPLRSGVEVRTHPQRPRADSLVVVTPLEMETAVIGHDVGVQVVLRVRYVVSVEGGGRLPRDAVAFGERDAGYESHREGQGEPA